MMQQDPATIVLFLGFFLTGIGSSYYHWDPSDATLFWDRLPMTIVFAGIIGAAVAQRIGEPGGRWMLAVLPFAGIASVVDWKTTGDLSFYALLQLGGFVTLAALLAVGRDRGDPIPWLWVVAFYAAAKIAEAGDHAIWNATSGLIAGHALKDLLAAAAVAAAL